MTELYRDVEGRRVYCGRCRHGLDQARFEGGPFDDAAGLTYRCGGCHCVYGVCRVCGTYIGADEGCPLCAAGIDPRDATGMIHTQGGPMLPKHIREADLIRDPSNRPGHWYDPATTTVVSMPLDWRPKGKALGGAPGIFRAAVIMPGDAPDPNADLAGLKAEMTGLGRGDLFNLARELGVPGFQTLSNEALIGAIADRRAAGVPADAALEDSRVGSRVEILMGRFEGKRGQVSEVGHLAAVGEVEDGALGVRVIVDVTGEELSFDRFEGQLRILTPAEVQADEKALAESQAQGA